MARVLSVKKTSISLTRGDSARIGIKITTASGEPYIPQEGDKIRFYLKKDVDSILALEKEISIDDMILNLRPEETKRLSVGDYIYDVELTKSNGDVDTFINCASLTIKAEVG